MSGKNAITLKPATLREWKKFLSQHVIPELGQEWRRRVARYPVQGEVRVSYRREGKDYYRELVLQEVSVTGVMAKHHQIVPDHTPLEMEIRIGASSIGACGVIVHSTETLGGFKIGIQMVFAD